MGEPDRAALLTLLRWAAERNLPNLWAECLKLSGETDQTVQDADDLADILYRLPVGY